MGSEALLSNTSKDTLLFYNLTKGALRIGNIQSSDNWNLPNIGQFSLAGGKNTLASGNQAFAFGDNSIATGSSSIALGKNTESTGNYSFAAGQASVI